MTIKFKIPNGSMKINANTFFQEAPRAKIRKMLKCFKDSEPDPEAVQALKDWLQEKIDEEMERKRDFALKESSEKEQLLTLTRYQEYLKMFCDNKEKVMEAKKDVANCKNRIRTAASGTNKAEKLAERYKGILEDACRILN